jgi:hypothetical protein
MGSIKRDRHQGAGNAGRRALSVFVCAAILSCTSQSNIQLSPTDPDNTIWVAGIVYQPGVIRNQTGRLKVPASNNYWVLAGENVFVKWSDYHAHVKIDGSIWDCNLCPENVARNAGRDICPLPDGSHVALGFAGGTRFSELGAPIGGQPQMSGLFLWSDGCFIPGPTQTEEDSPPVSPLTITVNRLGLWVGQAADASTTYPTRGASPQTAWFQVVPQGGHAVQPPDQLTPFVDPSTNVPDTGHWVWTATTSTDASGRVLWSENYGGGLAVGRVRVYKGGVFHDYDPNTCYPAEECDVFVIISPVVPRRIRVFDTPINTVSGTTNPFQASPYSCNSDPTAADGDIDFTRCRGGRAMSVLHITPTYDPGAPPNDAQDATFRQPFIWVAEFDAGLPAPTLGQGENLWIEFTLRDVH